MTRQEQKQLLELLKKVEPGFYPIELFWQFARLNTIGIVELVPIKIEAGGPKVLLINRSEDDAFWPGLPHVPGCVLRPTDTVDTALRRLVDEELGVEVELIKPLLTEVRTTRRGNELVWVHYCFLRSNPQNGTLYDAVDLPKSVAEDHLSLIEKALQAMK